MILLITPMAPGPCASYEAAVAHSASVRDAATPWCRPRFHLSLCCVLDSTSETQEGDCRAGEEEGLPPSCLPPTPLRTTLVTLTLQHRKFLPRAATEPTNSCPTHAGPASLHPSLRDTSISPSLGLRPSGASSKLRDISSARPTCKRLCLYNSEPFPPFSQPRRW